MTDTPAPQDGHPRAVRNVAVLATMSAVQGAQLPVYIVLGGLSGAILADDKSLATLPIACQMLTGMATAVPMSLFMGRYGRKAGFWLGGALAGFAGIFAALAMLQGNFWLLCFGYMFAGVYQSTQGYFRFAATDTASDDFKPKAISLVLAGGLVAALLSAEIVSRTDGVFSAVPFVGAYLFLVVPNLLGMMLTCLLDIPKPSPTVQQTPSRPWREILADRNIPVAMLCAMFVYGTMTLTMTSTPLAMIACGFGTPDAANVVKWHVIAMFAPSFFTGSIIARVGARPVIAVGLLLLLGCCAVALSGIEIHDFYIALILLGLGWNFGYIGATSLLAAHNRPEDRAKVQGLNDFLVMAMMATAALSSGKLMAMGGWSFVALAVMVPVAIAAAALLYGTLLARRGQVTGHV